MRAWAVDRTDPAAGRVRLVERPDPRPGPGELLVAVRACGVCRTDLHLRDGDLPPKRPGVVPGHQIVGEVVAHGAGRDPLPPRRPGRRGLAALDVRPLPVLPAG